MNLLKEKLNPNSEYNKKLRRDGIAMVKEMYKEAIECLESYIKKHPCNSNYKIKLAIEALEKQIPKTPIKIKGYKEPCFCPICEPSDETFVKATYDHDKYNYCPICGQKLDWGE